MTYLRERQLAIFLGLSLVFLAGCPQDDGGKDKDTGGNTTVDATADVGVDTSATPDVAEDTATEDTTTDTSKMDTGPRCQNPPDCPEGERLVGCNKCVSKMDRRCKSDHDCRPNETCKKFQHVKVCMYEPEPVRTCPGSEGCQNNDGDLEVGAASKVVTPQGFERPKPAGVDNENIMNFSWNSAPDEKWHDCGFDGLCPGDKGYTKADEGEGDGKAQGMWLAGFSIGRPAQYCPPAKVGCNEPDCCVSKYAHDNLKVQITAMTQGDTTVVYAVLDSVGWFHTDIDNIRDRIPESLGVDLLVMGGTHDHEAPDTAGQWGPGTNLPETSGRHPKFIERIYSQTVAGIKEAVNEAKPAKVEAAVLDVGWKGVGISDSRPPYIVNDDVPVVRFTEKSSGKPISTMVAFGNHAETLSDENPYITSDYPHYVRKYVREGLDAVKDNQGNVVKPKLPGFGGVTLFFPGTVGGLMTPLDGGGLSYGGEKPKAEASFEAASYIGQTLASHVLKAGKDGTLKEIKDPKLKFASKEFLSSIENKQFQLAAFILGVLERKVYNAARKGMFDYAPDFPKILTEVSVVRLGSVTFFTAPGEVFPETLTGGYPNKSEVHDPVIGDVREIETKATCDMEGLPTPGNTGIHPCIVKPDQKNPPDWNKTPDPPYMYETIPGDHEFFIGLGMDFLGYFVPKYDHKVDNYLNEAEGSHYEETNGLGPDVISDWKTNLEKCIKAVK